MHIYAHVHTGAHTLAHGDKHIHKCTYIYCTHAQTHQEESEYDQFYLRKVWQPCPEEKQKQEKQEKISEK